NLAALWLVSLACHQSVAASRPPASQLTAFYLWLSFGGALGGVAAAVAAPLLFRSMAELPLTLGLVCLTQVAGRDQGRWARRVAAVGTALALAGFALGSRSGAVAFGMETRALLHAERSFFGVHRVLGGAGLHLLVHGNTIHGAQATDLASSR